MAYPMTSHAFYTCLQAEGLRLQEIPGWRTHNRNRSGSVRRRWGPLNGVMLHHTVSSESGIVDLCRRGYKNLPGPLCHGVIHKSGLVSLVGWGRANHAGLGDIRALNAVIRESPWHPKPSRGTIDGNARFVGFECVNWGNGEDPWPEEQLDAMARASAAVCRYYGWNQHSVIGHKGWTNTKVDPRGVNMRKMRRRVQKLLARPAGH